MCKLMFEFADAIALLRYPSFELAKIVHILLNLMLNTFHSTHTERRFSRSSLFFLT